MRLKVGRIELTGEDMEIAPAPGGAIFLIDIGGARLAHIAPDGEASIVRSLAGLPSVLSSPSVDANQNLVLFAGNGDIIGVKGQDPNAADKLGSTYPALLIFKPDQIVSIGRDHMHAYPGFPIFATKLRQLVPHPSEGGWVSYDAGSGELLQVRSGREPLAVNARAAGIVEVVVNVVLGLLFVHSGASGWLWVRAEHDVAWRTGPTAIGTLSYLAICWFAWMIVNVIVRVASRPVAARDSVQTAAGGFFAARCVHRVMRHRRDPGAGPRDLVDRDPCAAAAGSPPRRLPRP